jgi:hypothetical protein
VEFLSAGTRTAMLGYLAADGRPLVAPAWFIVDNGELVFNTGREAAKGLALAIHVSSFASTTRIRPTRS